LIKPKQLAKEAASILEQRGKQYGNYEEVFKNFAARITLVLARKLKEDVTPAEGARILDELKGTRWDTGGYKRDHAVDGGNYKFIAGALEEKK
tara:strand:- start:1123 stop:1401 length:279 start_codon:yes stop_codon:yes gene_type:complete